MITVEQRAEAKRLYEVEKWRIGTIAAQFGVHHSAIRRALGIQPRVERGPRAMKLDEFLPFIRETLAAYPTLRSSRLFEMLKSRGYVGKKSRLREVVALLRPRKAAEAFLRLKVLAGEQGQVDWGHFGKLKIGRAEYILSAFVMVLSYSRAVYLRFFLGQKHEHFLRGHEGAFDFFGGVPRTLLYDNLKSAVTERRDFSVRFHPTLLQFSSHYGFALRAAAPYRGNEKGRVERAIRFVRDNFFAARTFVDIVDLNRQAMEWCCATAMERPWPEDTSITVALALAEERPRLLKLPSDRFPTEERVEVVVGKTPYARFDKNDYSVPHTHVRRPLLVVADLETVRIFDGQTLVAEHRRSFDRRAQIEDERHIAALQEQKKRARRERSKDRLSLAAPSSIELLTLFMVRGGFSLARAVKSLVASLDLFGAEALEWACKEAITKDTPHPPAVLHILENRAKEQKAAARLPLELPDDPRVRDIVVRPGSLDHYRFHMTEERTDDHQE